MASSSPSLASAPWLFPAARSKVSKLPQISPVYADHLSDAVAPALLQDPDFDLDDRMIRGGLSDNLRQSLELIEKATTLSSCGKIATSALLHSCSALELSIDHDDQLPAGSDLLLQEESDIYAARLAVCELSGADFPMPNECRSFVPSPHGKKTNFAGWINFGKGPSKPRIANDYYDQVTTANLKQCRRALGSSGQAWTSYSNSRQNAVAMCHAMQGAVERDESRHIAKILTNTAAATSESLHDAQEQADQIKQQFHELRTAMPKFQEDLASFDTNVQQTVQQFWSRFDQARSAVEELTTSIGHIQGSSREVRVVLDAVLETHLPKLAVAVTKAKQDIADSTDKAVASTEMVAYHQERMMQDAVTRLTAAGHSLDTINEKMPQLSDAIESNIWSSLRFYESATQRQLELLAVQNETMDGLGRINEKAADTNMHMDEANTKASSVVDKLETINSMLGPFVAIQDFFVASWQLLVYSFALGLLSIPFFHDCLDCKFKSSLCFAFVVMMGM